MKFLLLTVLLTATSAFANSERNLYDVMYLPEANTLFGSTQAAFVWGKAEYENESTGADIADVDISGYGLAQSVGYSLTDRLFISASMNYLHTETDVDYDGSTSESLTSDGLSDLDLNGRFRLLEDNWILDILAGGTLGLGDSKIATDDKDGNNLQGGNSIFAGLQIGMKSAGFQYALGLIGTHYFEATEKLDGEKTDVDAHTGYAFRGDILNSLAEKMYLRSFGQIEFINSFEDEDDIKTEQASNITLGTEFQYLLSKGLLLRAGVEYLNQENAIYGNVETVKDHLFTFLVGANYQY
jgi:hypothetical protein